MKHILILLALVFSMTSVNAQTTNAETQTTNAEQDYQSGAGYYEIGKYKQARYFFEKAAEQGHVYAQFYLGVMYYNGLGVSQDGKQALAWFEKAAKQGNVAAQSNLGAMYFAGQGVSKDNAQAFYWTQKAAKQTNAGAQFNLGSMYQHGLGVDEDYILAHMWFDIAVFNGYNLAQDNKNELAKKMSPEQITEAQIKAFKCIDSKYQNCDLKGWF